MIFAVLAFVAGLLTSLSPCVVPVLPVVLAAGLESKSKTRGLLAGIVLSFTLSTLFLASLIRATGLSASNFRSGSILLLAFVGLLLIFPETWQMIQTQLEKRMTFKLRKTTDTWAGGLIAGLSLGLIWTPCVGPVLGVVASLVSLNSNFVMTLLVTFSYAIGLIVPLHFISQGGRLVNTRFSFLRTHSEEVRQIFGLLLLATALTIWAGADRLLQARALQYTPAVVMHVFQQLENTLINFINK